MDQSPVLVIVPRLPPSVDGLGDYASALMREICQKNNFLFHFLVCDPSWEGPEQIEMSPVIKLSSRSSKSLLNILSRYQTVFLHYVGYGYAKRGCPFWLSCGLSHWRSTKASNKLVTMFHELYAFGPIWTSQFWTSPAQRWIAAKLSKLSDDCVTSKKSYAQIIKKFSHDKHKNIAILPVFSNIGELDSPLPLLQRKRQLVIFGSRGPRERVYNNSLKELLFVCETLKIETIFDIGHATPMCPDEIAGIKVNKLGIIPHHEIGQIFSESLVGFFNYPTGFLLKSGIFAAYCAHGVLPVGVAYPDQEVDQVQEGKHYVTAEILKTQSEMSNLQSVATQGFQWYQTHNLFVQADLFFQKLS